jgi:hypothetical protein
VALDRDGDTMDAIRKIILVGDRVRLRDGRIGEIIGPRDYSRSMRYPVQLSGRVVWICPEDMTVEKSITTNKEQS